MNADGINSLSAVARMKQRGIRVTVPECAPLLPGYVVCRAGRHYSLEFTFACPKAGFKEDWGLPHAAPSPFPYVLRYRSMNGPKRPNKRTLQIFASAVARMKQRGIRGSVPECAPLLPGYVVWRASKDKPPMNGPQRKARSPVNIRRAFFFVRINAPAQAAWDRRSSRG